ncbi:MAG: HAD hydrolase family protein [Sedimentisphaerales bacterium]|nr:HAD hydrolase family protein [Sedimentisphaerales bacterium]
MSIKDIKMLCMDVDGVMTDGGIIIHEDGTESKRFHVHDGGWLRIWARQGLKTAVITGRECKPVEHRMKALEIDFVYQGAILKLPVFEQLVKDSGFQPHEIAYIGDDVFDLPLLRRVGFAASVADAVPEVKEQVDFVTACPGGRGAVGELVRHLLKKMGLFEQAMERYK